MRRFVDLSFPLGSDLPPMKGHPAVDYRLTDTFEGGGKTNATISFSIHMGTHLDPPYHFFEDGLTIDQIPLDQYYLPGYIFNLRGQVEDYSPIRLEQVKALHAKNPVDLAGHFVIINSGWAQKSYDKPYYYSKAPWLEKALAEWLVEQRIGIVGVDNPPDKLFPDPATGRLETGNSPVHTTLLRNGIQIAENLANLEKLDGSPFNVVAFPLKIYRGCGGPARIVAIYGDAA